MNLSHDDVEGVWRIISSILLLGNLEIKASQINGVPDAALISNDNVLRDIAELLGISSENLLVSLTINTKLFGIFIIYYIFRKTRN